MKLKIYTALAFSVFLGYLPIVHALTDTVNNTIPTIETNWKYDQNSGRINLRITNKSDHPIRISPLIETGYSKSDLNDVPTSIFLGTSTRAVKAGVLFIAPQRKYLSYVSMREGPEPNPIEIAPGETKNVIFSDEDIILRTKGYTKAIFCLFVNNQIINTVALDNLNNILK